eukprot:UN12458
MFDPYFPWYPSYGRRLNVKWVQLKPPYYLPDINELNKVVTYR